MQLDFHYYSTYCASYLAGFDHNESVRIAYFAQFVDECHAALLRKLNAPGEAATTQLQMELLDSRTDLLGLQNITKIWSSFHFLPADLYAKRRGTRFYLNKYRLICGPDGELLKKTVELAKNKDLPSAGLAMHVLADTWAHRYFAGTPSLVINNTDQHFFEIFPDGTQKKIAFRHKTATDDPEKGLYSNSIFQNNENSIMNLGHGRAGHLPDYSFCVYKYLPAWGDYMELVKDNPSDYWKAFRQMIYALKYIRGDIPGFETGLYDEEAVRGHEDRIEAIIRKRQVDASDDWRAFGESLSGERVPDFDLGLYQEEYMAALKDEKAGTMLGMFFDAAIRQKNMVAREIFISKNPLAGIFSKKLSDIIAMSS